MPALRDSALDQAERLVRLAWRIAHGEAITRALVEQEYGVSRATAKRDVALLHRVLGGPGALPAGGQPPRTVERPGWRRVMLLSAGDD